MTRAGRSWQDIAAELAKESNPVQRRTLQRELRLALEGADFISLSRARESDAAGEDEPSDEEWLEDA